MTDCKQKVLSLAQERLNSRLFTHVFCSSSAQGSASNDQVLLDISPDGRDIYDLSSLTKALVTTPLVVKDAKRLRVSLDNTIGDWLDAANISQQIISDETRLLTPKSLLMHSAGLPFWKNFFTFCGVDTPFRQDLIAGLKHGAALAPNRGRYVYSDLGFLLLGRLLEIINNAPIDSLFGSLLEKLGLANKLPLSIGYPKNIGVEELKRRAISTGFCAVRQRELIGEVHDENCWALGGATGHAGLFGSGNAVHEYLKKLVQSEIGVEIIQNNLAVMSNEHESLVGWRRGGDQSSKTFGQGEAMGHLGFTGTAFWLVVDRQSVNLNYKLAILLTNRVISGRISPKIKEFRRDIFAALWDSLQTGTPLANIHN